MVHGTYIYLAFESRLTTTKLKIMLLESIESELLYLRIVADSGFLLNNTSGLAEVVQGLTLN